MYQYIVRYTRMYILVIIIHMIFIIFIVFWDWTYLNIYHTDQYFL